jgi:flagellar hook-associated protein 1 FlgK
LVAKINQRSEQTGITADVSADGSRIVLVQSDGLDISITNPEGELLTVNSLDQNFSELSSETALNVDTKIVGSLSLRSPRAFKVTSSLDAAVTANSQTLSKEEGGVRVDLTAGGIG